MYKSPDGLWEIVVPGSSEDFMKNSLRRFSAEDIQLVEGKPIDYTLDSRLERYVEERWNKKVADSIAKGFVAPSNGKLVRVSKMPTINDKGKLVLHLGPTNYREHIATNFHDEDYVRSLSYDQNANVLNAMALLISADDHLVYSVRGKTATGADKLSGFGVALQHPEKNPHEDILKAGPSYLFEQVRNAIFEETGTSEQKLDISLRGFAYVKSGFHVPLWIVNSSLEKGKIEEIFKERGIKKTIGASKAPKYTGMGFVPLNPRGYLEFIKNPQILEWVKPMVFYFGAMRFGLAQLVE